MCLFPQILAIRLLASVLPHRIDDLEERQMLLDRIFALLGNTLLTCANDPAISVSSMCLCFLRCNGSFAHDTYFWWFPKGMRTIKNICSCLEK